jgi:4-hydroxy-tetrahydrodipicolinate synthase
MPQGPSSGAQLRGSITPLVTPFREGRVDEAALRGLVDFQIAEGSHGVSVTGTTGEPSALSMAEREEVIEIAADAVAGRVPFLAGTGSNNLEDTLHLTRHAERAGANAVLVIVPYYIRPSQEGMYGFFRAVADVTSLRVVLYNIPGRTAQNLEPETMARLRRDAPNIVGVKEANVNLEQVSRDLALCGRDFLVFSGIEALCFPMLALGGSGHVSATANVAPRQVAQLYDLCAEDRWAEARDLHYRLLPLNEALFWETNPVPVKTALGLMGRIAPEVRLPLAPMSAANRARLAAVLGGYGLGPAAAAGGDKS